MPYRDPPSTPPPPPRRPPSDRPSLFNTRPIRDALFPIAILVACAFGVAFLLQHCGP